MRTEALGAESGMNVSSILTPAPAHARSQVAPGTTVVEPPSTTSLVVRSALNAAALGALSGAGLTKLPFIPGGAFSGALIGALVGAVTGTVRGIAHAREAAEAARALMLGSFNRPTDPGVLGPELPIRRALAPRPAARAVHRTRVVVRRGDTLRGIARRHHTTVATIHAANRAVIGADPNHIRVGARLIIER